MSKAIIISLFIVSNSICVAQRVELKSDSLFILASTKLFSQDYSAAEVLFSQALSGYDKDRNIRKMMECRMALATLSFYKSSYFNSLEMFQSLKKDHMRYFPNDTDRLNLIEFNIKECKVQIEKIRSNNVKQ